MPTRSWNDPNLKYKYGFIGQETDDEISGSGDSQDHKFRSYDPRLGRYKSLDPLARSYPWNSPYAYSENRVIDGIDLEDLEYATIEYKYYYGQTTPVYEVVWHNDLQHNTFGKLGPGVAFRTQTYDKSGAMVSVSATAMYYRLVDHGFYYGPTQLKDLWMVSHYIIEAVDAVDEAGRIHDMAYDAVGATADNATNSWGTIETDEALIESSCTKISKLGVRAIDPFNNQKINRDEIFAEKVVKKYFELTQWNKIEGVSDWMEQNYSSISKKGSSDK